MSDIQEAADKLSGLVNELSEPTEDKKPEVHEGQAKEQEAALSEDKAEQETPEGDTEAERKLYKVKVDGEELEVPEDELLKGYSRETHYQKKMKALSEQRESIETKAQQVDAQLADARAILEDEIANLESPEMLELKQYDADAYVKAVDKVRAKLQRFENLKAKRAEEHQKRMDKLKADQKKALVDAFPDWGDEESYSRGVKELDGVLISMGIKENELEGSAGVDHRMYLIAKEIADGRKARQELDAIKKANLEAKEVKSKPKSIKPGTVTNKDDRQSTEVKQMRDQLRKTGSIHDAVKILQM